MKNQPKAKKQIDQRPVDALLDEYASFHTNAANRIISYFTIPLVSFGILAFVWSIPFPPLAFLGKNQTFINWASFVVALTLYYYLRLSPMLSYIMLFFLGVFSYVIVSLEQHLVLAQIGLLFCILGSVGQLIGYNKEGRRPIFAQEFKFMLIAPMWLFSLILKKFKIRY